MPEPAPVTIATFPSKPRFIVSCYRSPCDKTTANVSSCSLLEIPVMRAGASARNRSNLALRRLFPARGAFQSDAVIKDLYNDRMVSVRKGRVGLPINAPHMLFVEALDSLWG